jgi:hypothetical protein
MLYSNIIGYQQEFKKNGNDDHHERWNAAHANAN